MSKEIDLPKKIPSLSFIWNAIYLGFIFLCGLLLINYHKTMGIVVLLFSIIMAVLQTLYTKKTKNEIADYIHSLAFNMDSAKDESFIYLPLPYVMVDKSGSIHWYNPLFEDVVGESNIIGKNICQFISDLSSSILEKDKKHFIKQIHLSKRHYMCHIRLLHKQNEDKENAFKDRYIIYFIENTEQWRLRSAYENEKSVVGLIYIDNYDEVMENIEDVRKPLVLAVIEKRISSMAGQVQGVIKKFEKDKYILFFPKKYLKNLEENKFEILDQVREVDIGHNIPVTLSMGIGVNGESYGENHTFARAALDLVLGRGGDQAIIKNKDKVVFFGGKTKEVEKSTKVKARVKSYALRELIEDSDRVVVMGHKNLDLDCLGAAIGISRAAKSFQKPVNIIITNVTLAIESIYNKMLQSGQYDDLFIDVSQAKQLITDKTLLVVVDVHRPNYTESEELLKQSKSIVVIDHHRKSVEFIENAVLTYLEPYASSTCELVTEVLQYIKEKIKLEPIEADALLAGITVDTKNFVFKTGVRTFEAASYLRRSGADSTRVRMLFKNDMDTYRAKSSTVSAAEIFKEHVAISICPTYAPNPIVVVAQAADELLNIQGIQASFVLVEAQEKIMISGRSLGDINVQVILEKLGGGGHMTVAGAQLVDMDIEAAKSLLKQAINDYMEEGEK